MSISSFASKGIPSISERLLKRLHQRKALTGYPLSEINQGNHLHLANPETPAHFFESRCFSTSSDSVACVILYSTPEQIYYGSPKASAAGDSIQKIYVVPRSELEEQFPNYQMINGTILESLLIGYLDSLRPSHQFRLLQTFPFIPFLQRDGIELNIDWQYQIDDQDPVHILLCLILPWNSTDIRRLY